jgi:hypothetical protein
MFAKIVQNSVESFPYTMRDLRRDNPNTSFPSTISDEELENFNVFRVTVTPTPENDPKTHRLEHSCELVDGAWTQVWTKHQIELSFAEKNIRNHRNELLEKSDWTQLADSSVSAVWTDYRQELRDVPQQEGFPYEIVWPEEPAS